MKIYVFGTGELFKRYKHLFQNMDIQGFIDNDCAKWGSILDGKMIVSPAEAISTKYDYIVLVSIYYEEMRKQLVDMGVAEEKILDKEHAGVFQYLSVSEQYMFTSNHKGELCKKVVLFSHVLNLTGAPIVLCRLAKTLKKMGYEVTVVAEKNSTTNHNVLLSQLLREQISVVMVHGFELFDVGQYVRNADFVVVCTVVMYGIIERLLELNKKVYWWLHETEDVYECIEGVTYPHNSNLYFLSVGWMATESFERHSGQKIFRTLPYGVPQIPSNLKASVSNEIIRFGLVGAYSERKAQEILFEAIKRNFNLWQGHAEFYFVGYFPDSKKHEYEMVDNVHVLGEMEPEKVYEFYDNIDVLITPSLQDPLPVVVTEAMQHKLLCLVSDRVGQCRYITPMVDGMVCKAGSVEDLAEKINWIIDNKESIVDMGEKSYMIYEQYFSMESFEQNVRTLLKDTL